MAEHEAESPFVSCIKVKGINLLPPLITQKRRAELLGYKQQAIKLEKRLQSCKDLKKCLEDMLSMQSLTDRPQSDISFRDDTHLEALGITENIIDNHSKTKMPRQVRLTKDIVDVTQYDSNGVKVMYADENCTTFHQGQHLNYNDKNDINTNTCQNELNQFESSVLLINNQDTSNTEVSVFNSNTSSEKDVTIKKSPTNSASETNSVKNISSSLEKSPKPRLIRSNSYTLDTPSPILLAHLEKTEKNNRQDELKNGEDIKHLPISRNWSSLDNNYLPFENSEFSSINTVYNTNFNDSNEKNIDMESSTPIEKNERSFEGTSSPSVKVFHTDISVQNITVTANNEILDDALNENNDSSDSQLLQVLKSLPDIYAKQIIELIEAQKLEKQKAVTHNESERYVNSRSDDLPRKDHHQVTAADISPNEGLQNVISSTNLTNEYRKINELDISLSGSERLLPSTASISPSQSIYYTLSGNTLRPMSNSSTILNDLDYDLITSDEKSSYPRNTVITEYYVRDDKKRMSVNRELFPQQDCSDYKSIKQEWAASIIGAHVKGYLTRRLLRTERVQSLIETIKDALLCALQLHNSENIDESDVELHRRLMNQVSAACFTFHDIFFTLSVHEQMTIISADRQRKLEKAKRPSSAPNDRRRSGSTSNRSTPRQRLPSQSQSLTKV